MNLNVFYTINNKYIDIMLVSITSLIMNNESYEKIKFHIICSEFELSDYKRLEEYLTNFPNIEFEFYPLADFDISKYNIPNWHGKTQAANAVLFYQSIIKPSSNIENILYLDADTIVVDDLKDLNKSDDVIMAVKDPCPKSYLKYLNLDNYYNSGVLLFNNQKWENNSCEDKIAKFLTDNPNIKLYFPDQDILNLVLSKSISPLEYKYNIGTNTLFLKEKGLKIYCNEKIRQFKYEEIEESLKNPKIYHCYGLLGLKPWTNNKVNPLNDTFMEYMNIANPNFSKSELHGLKKILNTSPELFYNIILLRSLMPSCIERQIRTLILSKNK